MAGAGATGGCLWLLSLFETETVRRTSYFLFLKTLNTNIYISELKAQSSVLSSRNVSISIRPEIRLKKLPANWKK